LVEIIKREDLRIISKLFCCNNEAKNFYTGALQQSRHSSSMTMNNRICNIEKIGDFKLSNEIMWELTPATPFSSNLIDIIIMLMKTRNSSICQAYNEKNKSDKKFRAMKEIVFLSPSVFSELAINNHNRSFNDLCVQIAKAKSEIMFFPFKKNSVLTPNTSNNEDSLWYLAHVEMTSGNIWLIDPKKIYNSQHNTSNNQPEKEFYEEQVLRIIKPFLNQCAEIDEQLSLSHWKVMFLPTELTIRYSAVQHDYESGVFIAAMMMLISHDIPYYINSSTDMSQYRINLAFWIKHGEMPLLISSS